jgi:hypothetical protein
MTTPNVAAASSATAATAATAASQPARSRPASHAWLRGAFLLAGAAQLITISALLSVDPLATTWYSLLLAIAPVLLCAAAAFAPVRIARPAAVLAVVALVVGIIGGALHTGLFFFPALVALVAGVLLLWREMR